MKYLTLAILTCIVSTCGTVETSYTSKRGATYHVAVDIPNQTAADAK